MTPPTTIRVGYRTFKLLFIEDPDPMRTRPPGAPRDGVLRDKDGIISIDGTMSPADQAVTAIHELLHACWRVGCIPTGADEEHIVSVLSNMLALVWQYNPALIHWLSEAVLNDGPKSLKDLSDEAWRSLHGTDGELQVRKNSSFDEGHPYPSKERNRIYQRLLAELGYFGVGETERFTDGIIGNQTREAVLAFMIDDNTPALYADIGPASPFSSSVLRRHIEARHREKFPEKWRTGSGEKGGDHA